ncbi:MAG: addiction module antitoxin RelB [Armatimonadetes bacterium CG_4_10_14_3_um_filter_66_18]|nr:addiction module protein [Armatimonadota bacterium]PIU88058.1 MAG: addiction module antitoxin RelB [Armatimonadetes bacterium CG06_land_8_20_14_3_00_66_21]PIW17632.1 MAG: addiction module antitoxin RelB [Armatimonadetes bacterium CG17_big_fil_post_rev_8_21_14_2_50_66_6]PIX50069.1 MAG: addiction module antitoxin RelB [Armatimonadetes bacterium CG_4_8_14_3_um_filter_66_20]PIY50107.1 MAG: addiction module antitoxin RelB [Armatimonadetes bacterium CG_4_10_14_3_um_filter_66_18]PIZ33467.1 MAG: ad
MALPLDQMTVAEKLQTMERLWDDLCRAAPPVSSPAWHQHVLSDRATRVTNGTAGFADWEDAKRRIRAKTS